jgi:hypothetical protein
MKKILILAGCIVLTATGSASAQDVGVQFEQNPNTNNGLTESTATTGVLGETFENFQSVTSTLTGSFAGSTFIANDPGVNGSFTTTTGTVTTTTVVPATEIGTSGITFNIQFNGDNDENNTPNTAPAGSPSNSVNTGASSINPFQGHAVGFGTDVDVVQFDNLIPGDEYEIAVYSGGTGDADGVKFYDGTFATNPDLVTPVNALNSVGVAQTSFIPEGTAGANYVTDTMFVGASGSLAFNIEDDAGVDSTSVLNGFGIENLSAPENAAVPEPSTWALLALGVSGLLIVVRRRAAKL